MSKERDIFVVDSVPETMTNLQIVSQLHSLAHELFRRLEPDFYENSAHPKGEGKQ